MTPPKLGVATYNILADAYIKPEFYPRCDPKDFAPKVRHLRLDGYLSSRLDDVFCLQEVEYAAFARLDHRLRQAGFVGRWAHKGFGKPDGCATFVRTSCGPVRWSIEDLSGPRDAPSGHVALIARLERMHGLTVVNTHIKWDRPETPRHEQVGLAQAIHLISLLGAARRTVICGDMNATPDHPILERFRAAGYADPHPPTASTFNAGGARKIDYLLHTDDLVAEAALPTAITDETPMPSPAHPSDHLLLAASFLPKDA